MQDRFYVYQHRRCDSGEIFYVGKGQGRRAWNASKHHRSVHWQRVVAKCGLVVEIVAEGLPEDLALLAEVERIDQLRRLGAPLCNQTDGGDGTSGWVKSASWRASVGAKHRGKIVAPETRAKLSESVKATGYRHPEEVRRRMSSSRAGHQPTLGMKHSEETRAKMRRAHAARAPALTVSCPHCGAAGSGGSMVRWHFSACRKRGA